MRFGSGATAAWQRHESPTRHYLRSFVDDIRYSVAGTEAEVVQEAIEDADNMARGLVGAGCKISEKTVILASRRRIRQKIWRALKNKGIQAKMALVNKDLGVAATSGVRRTMMVLKMRMKGTFGRIRRIKLLARLNRRAAKLYPTGAWPQSAYGKEAVGVDGFSGLRPLVSG